MAYFVSQPKDLLIFRKNFGLHFLRGADQPIHTSAPIRGLHGVLDANMHFFLTQLSKSLVTFFGVASVIFFSVFC